eukprot:5903963-Pleurochrysis_carterae.AAC.1
MLMLVVYLVYRLSARKLFMHRQSSSDSGANSWISCSDSITVNFVVRDTGPDISLDDQAKILNRDENTGSADLCMLSAQLRVKQMGAEIVSQSPWQSSAAGTEHSFAITMRSANRQTYFELETNSSFSPSCEGAREDRNGMGVLAPAAEAPFTPWQITASAPPQLFRNGLNVLVADDQKTNRTMLQRTLCKYINTTWQVVTVGTGEEALS